jgi:hypothetical protein
MSAPLKNYTVKELKEMAKTAKIVGYSTKVKAELEAALGLPVTGKPRSPKAAAPVAPASSAQQSTPKSVSSTTSTISIQPAVPAGPPIEYIQLKEVYDDSQTISLIQLSDVKDLVKLKEQIKLPIEERERPMVGDEQSELDYVELLLQKRKRTIKDLYVDYASNEIIKFSAVVYMYAF